MFARTAFRGTRLQGRAIIPQLAVGPPTSVLLPTTRGTEAIESIARQLEPDDELLVICDMPDDDSADVASAYPNTRVVIAGQPDGCSGKANAIAAGMAAATNDRILWSDDDFEHPRNWVATFHRAYERHGPVSELYVFRGNDPLAMLLEPVYAIGGTCGTYVGDRPWGGAVMFDRDDLDCEAFIRDLRRTISDDGLLHEYLEVTTLDLRRTVPIGGTVRASLERHVRFTKIIRHFDTVGLGILVILTWLLLLGLLTAPLLIAVGVTVFTAGVYARFQMYRWTMLLAVPAILLQAVLVPYALVRRSFRWGPRRYRWRSKFSVEVLD